MSNDTRERPDPSRPVVSTSAPESAADPGTLTRRELLARAGALAGTAALAGVLGCATEPAAGLPDGFLPVADQGADGGTADADAAPTLDVTGGDTADAADVPGIPDLTPVRGDGSHPFDYIDTVVVLQMENRSFDHYFGALSLLEGRTDVEGLTKGLANPGPKALGGKSVPIRHLTDSWVINPDPPHSQGPARQQWNGGANDGFVRAWYDEKLSGLSTAQAEQLIDLVMGYHTRSQLPALYTLADAFTLCDHWHASALCPTWPNRFYSHCATSNGVTTNLNPIDAPSPYSLLAKAGLRYGTYFTSLYFLAAIQLQSPMARPISRFFTDARNGTLPNVSIVEPDFLNNDDHPPHDIREGQLFIASVYEALRQSPQWNRSLLVIFYDEHGGFHDHVPPPAAKGNVDGQGFGELGFRVPGLLAGPLVRRGEVLHTTFDHSSVPAMICRIFGLPQLNQRAELAGDLGEALSLDLVPGKARPEPPVIGPLDFTSRELEQQLARTLERDPNQPELLELFRRRGLLPLDARRTWRDRHRTFLDEARRLGTLRVR